MGRTTPHYCRIMPADTHGPMPSSLSYLAFHSSDEPAHKPDPVSRGIPSVMTSVGGRTDWGNPAAQASKDSHKPFPLLLRQISVNKDLSRQSDTAD